LGQALGGGWRRRTDEREEEESSPTLRTGGRDIRLPREQRLPGALSLLLLEGRTNASSRVMDPTAILCCALPRCARYCGCYTAAPVASVFHHLPRLPALPRVELGRLFAPGTTQTQTTARRCSLYLLPLRRLATVLPAALYRRIIYRVFTASPASRLPRRLYPRATFWGRACASAAPRSPARLPRAFLLPASGGT